nr:MULTISPECIES: ATP-binding cassette domain-containing protein [unclassified Streptomyces]
MTLWSGRHDGGATVNTVLDIKGLEVAYGKVEALRGLDLTVRENEIVALLGNNGAGKSTTVSAISGLVRPRAGTVSAFGEDITRATPWSIVERGKEKDVSCVGRSRA